MTNEPSTGWKKGRRKKVGDMNGECRKKDIRSATENEISKTEIHNDNDDDGTREMEN